MPVRPARPSDIDDVVRLLHENMDPSIEPARWRRLFLYPWLDDKPDLGRVAIVDGRIVGVLGAVYSDRMIDGRMRRIVNPTAWYLERPARREGKGLAPGLGLGMMTDLTRDPDRHYLINTSSRLTVALVRRAGFDVLDSHKYVWRPGRDERQVAVERIEDTAQLASMLTTEERRMLSDHARLSVLPALFVSGGERLLLVLSVTQKGENETWFDLLYASDRQLLPIWGQAIANSLLPRAAMVLACDSRFCASPPHHAARVPLKVPRFFKSTILSPARFDHMYTEVPLLGLKLS